MNINILTFDAASGHKSAAEAIRRQLAEEHPDADVRIVDLEEILQYQTKLLGWVYRSGIDYFNWCMRKERYFFFTASVRAWILFAAINTRVKCLKFLLRWTAEFWNDDPPDVIVSVTPMLHTLVYEAARTANPDVKCITIPVDYSEPVPGYWFQPKIQQHYLVGDGWLYTDAIECGIPADQIVRLGGMMIDPRFYHGPSMDRNQTLSSLGLDPNLPTGVISFGGQGTVNVLRCARAIRDAGLAVNLVCLTGRNEQLKLEVGKLDSRFPVVARGFQQEPPVDVLLVADFLIGKPGTMTLNEALITDTPFIFIESKGLQSIQGRNEEWVLEQKIGLGAATPEDVPDCIKTVLSQPAFKERIRECHHRGIFDASRAIGQLLDGSTADSATRETALSEL